MIKLFGISFSGARLEGITLLIQALNLGAIAFLRLKK